MKLLRLNALPSNTQLEKTAVTIGNFDGVHLGHQAMIHQLKAVAKLQNLKTVVMIFEPQPREFFAKKTRQLLIPWAFFAFLLFAYLFVLKLNETHNWAKAISLPVTSMFDGFLGDENSFILFHVNYTLEL